MHTVTSPEPTPSAGAARPAARVAVAGATGYTGQELLRLLARHPGVRLTLATSSGAASAARRLPALARLWDGSDHAARSPTRSRARPTSCSSRCPTRRRRSSRRALVDAGVRVIDLSGAFRLRDAAVARALVSGDARSCRRASPTASPSSSASAVRGARLVANPGCYPTAALLALAPLAAAGLLVAGRRRHRRREVGRVGRRQDAVGAHALLRSATAACRRTACSATGTAPRSSRGSGARSRSRRTWCRSIAASSRRSTCACAPGTTEEALGDVYERAYADATFVRLVGSALPEIKHVAHTNFCDIGWRVDPSGRAILVSVIDNLLKGASGQAVQNMNVMLGLDETTGLL